MQRSLLTLPLVATLLAGCSSVYVPSFIQVYQPDIQQGNIYEEAQIERLREGMPQSQVRAILGTPSLNDIFHQGQRDTYIYYDKRGKEEAFRHTLVIEYDSTGRVASIQRDGMDLAEAPSMNSAELPDEAEAASPSNAPTNPASGPTDDDNPYDLETSDDGQPLPQTPPAQDPL
ncbi:outer membrane protein assembly factor BamE [Guyparkeria hydrothermalis]|nr:MULTISPECIES: outer membrane protein assembly factor BamE [Guyparkeria]MCL7751474.1 outer membrane protein assembly factor BamE [Guyparkeria hydrothermalis]